MKKRKLKKALVVASGQLANDRKTIRDLYEKIDALQRELAKYEPSAIEVENVKLKIVVRTSPDGHLGAVDA